MDIKNYYIEKGEGEALILLHGNGENSDYFVNQIDEFSKYYHVYAIDTRGHGKTERGTLPFTIRQFSKDLLNFMDDHRIEKANILGFSDGGNIALIFALNYPNRIEKLILNGANLDGGGIKRSVQFPIEIGYKFASKNAQKNKKAKQKAELLGLMVNDPNISPTELKNLKMKTLVIVGTHDMVIQKHTELIANSIENSTLKIIKGDHFIANKKPYEFNKAVLNFLKE